MSGYRTFACENIMSNEVKKRPEEDRPKVYVRSLNRIATVRRIEQDPVWGPQYLVSTYSREWGPDYFWVKGDDVEEVGGAKPFKSNKRG